MRLIDANRAVMALQHKAKQAFDRNGGTYDNVATNVYREAAELVDKLPTVTGLPTIDAVKHGCWLKKIIAGVHFWVCSYCGFFSEAAGTPKVYNYCPNCGARMDEVRK